jgi:predicted amidohydrolase
VIGLCSLLEDPAGKPAESLRRRLAMVDRMAEEAARQGWALDLAVLPECSFGAVKSSVEEVAESIHGRTISAIAEKAKQHGAYATAPVQLRRDGKVYNSVVMLDRRGEPLGIYSKVFPVMMTDGSLEYGITPGSEFPVFDLDFGRVGVQICWDIASDAGWQALADQDAELVVHCTDPATLVAMRGRAWQHGYYIGASTFHPPALLADPLGRVVATASEDDKVLVVKVDLDYRVLHSNCLWEWPQSKAQEYEGRIKMEWDPDAHEYLVTSCDRSLPVRRFLEKEGLLTGRQRNRRNIALQDRARGGPPTMPEPVERD